MEKYKIIIDRKEYFVNTQFITGKQIKILAGITEEMERLAKATYGDESMGWFVWKITEKTRPYFPHTPEPDEKIDDNDEIDLVEDKGSKFYTACNGTCRV